jgi:protein-tyrosine phosphatase
MQAGFDAKTPGQFIVESAGTGALTGSPIDPRSAGMIRVLGGSADNFEARQITPELLQPQDLVLALTRAHRSQVVEMAPEMLRKTFTLRELARILPELQLDKSLRGASRWRAAMPMALRARGKYSESLADYDVVDPYKRADSVFQEMVREIEPAVATLLAG